MCEINLYEEWQHGFVVACYTGQTYCSYCGRKLERKTEPFGGYDTDTGIQRVRESLGCPRYGKVNEPGDWHDYWWENTYSFMSQMLARNARNAS